MSKKTKTKATAKYLVLINWVDGSIAASAFKTKEDLIMYIVSEVGYGTSEKLFSVFDISTANKLKLSIVPTKIEVE